MFLSSMIAKQAGRGMNKKVCKQMIKASLLNNSSNNNIIVQRQRFSTSKDKDSKIKGGFGVMFDDVVAGFQTLIVLSIFFKSGVL